VLARALAGMATAVSAFLVVTLGSAAPAHADGEGCHSERDPETGQIKIVCEEEEEVPGGENDDSDGGSSTCTANGQTIPCQVGNAPWNGTCYVTDLAQDPQQPPPAGQTAEDGEWYACLYPPGVTGPSWAWRRTGEVLVDPVVVAYKAIANMELGPITIGIVPESAPNRIGLVGLPVWMWVDNQTEDTWGPITRSATDGPVTVSATANATSVVWDMGDGTNVNCAGPGTPYADHYGKQESRLAGTATPRCRRISPTMPTRSPPRVTGWSSGPAVVSPERSSST